MASHRERYQQMHSCADNDGLRSLLHEGSDARNVSMVEKGYDLQQIQFQMGKS